MTTPTTGCTFSTKQQKVDTEVVLHCDAVQKNGTN